MTRSATLDPLTLPLNGSTLIEASAGTGKTFTLAILYVRLVLGHGQPESGPLARGLAPPNLLVVTFTEAATKELRDRIRARLTQAAEVFAERIDSPDSPEKTDPPAETALLYQLRDQDYPDPATWPECRKRLLLAAEWMDEAAVSTIHGWCNRMLSEHAFDSGSLFRVSLETDQTALLDDVVRDYWRTFAYPLAPELTEELLSHWKTPTELRKAVRNLLADKPAASSGTMDNAIEAAVRQRKERSDALKAQPWHQWHGEVLELLTALGKRLHGNSRKAMVTSWDNLLAWVDSGALLPDDLDKAGLKNQTPDVLPTKLKGDGPIPHHPAFDAIADLLEFSANLPDARADILRHASGWISARLEAEKQQRSEMGFDDLLTRLDEALHGPRGPQLAATIRRQFPAALIDEFQDTDPVQYRIFDRIYRVADNNPDICLLMIGDPKQAIYGFRGADIFTYLEARKGVQDRTYTLGRNFRSSDAMVAAVNRVFLQGDQLARDGAFLFGKGDATPLPFQPVAAKGTRRQWTINGQAQPSLVLWTLESEQTNRQGETTFLTRGQVTDQVAATCASEVARLLALGQQAQAGFVRADDPADMEPVTPGDIAILVNNRNEAAAVRDALRQRRIRSVYLSDRDSVLRSPEAAEILSWLKAFAEPRQLSLARTALATPTLALPWHYLDRILTDEIALEQEIERFIGYHQQWQRQGILPTLRRFLMDFGVPARLLQHPDGERRLTDILHIAELLQQDSLQLDGEHALVHHYTQLLRAADDENEHRILRLESDAGLVKVITVHKSKGLEYPLVFLPFGTAFRAENEKQAFVRYHDKDGRLVTVFDPEPEDIAKADRERLGEDIRKLYVALTRARHGTWVGASALQDWHQSGLGYLLNGSGSADGELTRSLQALAGGEPAITVTPLPEADTTEHQEPAPAHLGPALASTREPREDWWIASYSSLEYTTLSGTGIAFMDEAEDAEAQNLLEEARHQPGDEPASPAAEGPHRFPRGAGPGTFLHDMLEWCATEGMATVAARPDLLRNQLARRCRVRGWSDWVEPLTDWLTRVLTAPLPLSRDGEPAVSLAELNNPRPELEFWFESRQVPTGRLDDLVTRQTLNGADRPRVEKQQFNGMIKGFIDLVFEHQGRYYVLDYKSNTLGGDDLAYTRQAMGEAILGSRYDLQYVLYLLALHRLLKARLPGYDYDSHMGGAVYLFLRGIDGPARGAFVDKPPKDLIATLDALFDGDPGKEAAA